MDGLPFSTEGYTRAKNVLKNKHGNTTEIVNAYVQNIMTLLAISGTQPWKIHNFYEKLLFNVQALETLDKLTEINGYVRMSIDKLEGMTSGVNGTFQNLSTHYEWGPRETPANQERSEMNFKVDHPSTPCNVPVFIVTSQTTSQLSVAL